MLQQHILGKVFADLNLLGLCRCEPYRRLQLNLGTTLVRQKVEMRHLTGHSVWELFLVRLLVATKICHAWELGTDTC